ncbi:hypothetical protein C6P46_004462 [Rhodotorula mucilaginosa]|uniref:Uncharacterized protein n=1 Tax=Rhodotorula mucilaginosa TaxID=5537 RepID=A0A9P6W2M6_RHOMI|nr:hypothetical protein C6P46_004462 [Rhodotorula mucilaginosa]
MVLPRHGLLRSPLHRVPVLWSLYRPLLRSSRLGQLNLPLEHVSALQNYIRQRFKHGRHLTGVGKLLDQLETAHESSTKAKQVCTLAAHLAARESLRPPRPPRPVQKPLRKPRVYPSIMHATQFYHPIPRLRPQPIEITMTIFNRRRTSQRRYDKLEQAKQFVQLAQAEERFKQDLLARPGRGRAGTGGGGGGEARGQGRLGDEWRTWIKDAREREKREVARSKLRISPELQEQARKANRARELRRAQAAHLRKSTPTAALKGQIETGPSTLRPLDPSP